MLVLVVVVVAAADAATTTAAVLAGPHNISFVIGIGSEQILSSVCEQRASERDTARNTVVRAGRTVLHCENVRKCEREAHVIIIITNQIRIHIRVQSVE